MSPRTQAPRPIRRTPAPYIPPGPKRVLDALRPFRHTLRPGEDVVLAFAKWMDLHMLSDLRRLDEEVVARLARADHARHRVGPFDRHDRIGASPGDEPRRGLASPVPLWRPPAEVAADVEGGPAR